MDTDDTDGSGRFPDAFEITVDGVDFGVTYDLDQPGAHHYTRRTPPASGYGFTSRRSDQQRSTTAQHVAAIRSFLAMVDPETGYIEDEPNGDVSDGVADGPPAPATS